MKGTMEAARIADWLMQIGMIGAAQRNQALERFQSEGGPQITHYLVEMGAITFDQHAELLSQYYRVPFVDLNAQAPSTDSLRLVPRTFCEQHDVIPVSYDGQVLTVAMANPGNVEMLDELRRVSRSTVKPAVADVGAIRIAIGRHYGSQPKEADLKLHAGSPAGEWRAPARTSSGHPGAGAPTGPGGFPLSEADLAELDKVDVARVPEIVEHGPVVMALNRILVMAIAARASDIHIEPTPGPSQVRFRVDGLLYDMFPLPPQVHAPVVSRVKVLSGMDITERMVPQDGRFTTNLGGHELDLRVSSLPSQWGEKVVMRLLDKATARLPLEKLGMNIEELAVFERMIRRPWGMVIITGPTGSGKTTTLYAALEQIKTTTKNIITIEDPLEYQLDRVTQVQVNERQGLTFANVLRSALRQDPDIIMVGEIRDTETAELAVRAALTGHLVLTTLHTNDASGAIPRLVDMGIPPYLVASSMTGVAAQRLVRRICPQCRQPVRPSGPVLAWAQLTPEELEGQTFYAGRGCPNCNQSGYAGRIAVYELLPMGDEVRQITLENVGAHRIRELALSQGMTPLREAAFRLVRQGITSLEEMVNATVA